MGRMYPERVKNIPVMRYCEYSCVYCGFQKFQKISACDKCRAGVNHSHLEVLKRTPPKTEAGKFITIGLSGDVSFMPPMDFYRILQYCNKWYNRTFLIQSKNPNYFVKIQEKSRIPDNAILNSTIETNKEHIWDISYTLKIRYDYQDISGAPLPEKRYEAMRRLDCRKAITIEPILDFDLDIMLQWTKDIAPEFIYIGYNSKKDIKLPEPSLSKTTALIAELRGAGFDVREKLLRKAFYE